MALRTGLTISEYELMTPRELNIHIEEFYSAKEEAEKSQAMFTYMGALLPLMKKFPTFEDAFGYKLEKEEKVPQTAADMLAEVKKINAALGGTTY
ncbi:hypothetical protein AB4Z17_29000 [Paenibacillus sp. TAF43_2]|uniref:hypothetical protein n=1 Tax=Paenibacillus sp. TAF43_2 TaxID=3233069 RepID=UPI003F9B2A3F